MAKRGSGRKSLTGPLHNIAVTLLNEQLAPNRLVANYAIDSLKQHGVRVDDARAEEIRRKYSEPLALEAGVSFDWPDVEGSATSITIDSKKLLDYVDGKQSRYDELLLGLIDRFAIKRYSFIEKNSRLLFRDHQYMHGQLAANRTWLWGDALDGFGSFVCGNDGVMQEISKNLLKWRRGFERVRWSTMMRLHARGCQVAREIHVLLSAGYADGALARWRTLHEICSTAAFLMKADARVSQMYNDHADVATLRSMQLVAQRDAGKKRGQIAKRSIKAQEKHVDTLCKRWGTSFRRDYGWASSTLGKDKPTYLDIEQYADQSYARVQYKLASQQVHSHILALEMKFATSTDYQNHLLTGPTNYGIAVPARYTILTLMKFTLLIATKDADIDRMVVCKCLNRFGDKVIEQFDEVAASQHNAILS
jgi:hypothetical protein